MGDAQATAQVGKTIDRREFDIPVLFQVTAEHEDDAAEKLAYILGHSELVNGDTAIESWHMPNHQEADGSDNPVRVVILHMEPAYSDRQALVAEIEDLVSEHCHNCGARMNLVVRGHHHSENGEDVTRPYKEDK